MFTVALSVLFLAAASDTSGTATTAPVAQASEAPKTVRKICKREEATESRLGGKRVCLTAEQWRERQNSATRDFDDVRK